MLDISTENGKEAVRKETEFKVQMAALEAQRDWEKRRAQREQERLDAIPKWQLWLLVRLPRPSAVALIALGDLAGDGLRLVVRGVPICLLGGSFLGIIVWAMALTGTTVDPTFLMVTGVMTPILPCVVIADLIWERIKTVNEALPKREKKHD